MTVESNTYDKAVIIISATQEWLALKDILHPAFIQSSPYGEWFEDVSITGDETNPLIFFQGGWGKTNAAGSAQYAIDHWQPEFLINLGTCGGFAGEVQPSDIILVDKAVIYDIVEQMLDPDIAINAYTTHLDLSFVKKPYPQTVIQTLMVSGDRDLIADQVPFLKEKYGAIAGDWETGSIAYVAKLNQVKCLILRGVSDLVSPIHGGEAYNNINLFTSRSKEIMELLLMHLPGWMKCLKWADS